jgi:hypothetical protein
MTEYQAEIITTKLREAESLLLPLIGNDARLHDAMIYIWSAIDKLADSVNAQNSTNAPAEPHLRERKVGQPTKDSQEERQ